MVNIVKLKLRKLKHKLTKDFKIDFCTNTLNNSDNDNYVVNYIEPVKIQDASVKTNDFISTPSTFQNRIRIVTKLSSPFFKPQSTKAATKEHSDNSTNFNPPMYSTVINKTKTKTLDYVHDSLTNNIYICCVAHKATLEGDISINYSDQLKVICHNNDFALVEHCISKKHGFVPKYCIITLEKFLNDNKTFV